MKIQHFMALVVLSLATVPGARAAVLAGPITNAVNAHSYYLLSSNTWTASEAEAVGLGGHLVTINDAAENQWVLNTFFPLTGVPYASLWIGLNDAANEGQFVWANGEPVAFTYWYPGEPNNLGGEDYASIRHPSEAPPTGSWNDLADTPNPPTFGVVEVPTPLPVAVTQPADQFMPGSARLNGQANPNGSPTLAWFEWGTSLAYGNVTPPQSVGSGSNAVGLSNVIVGLVSGTDYHFRARASNAFGSLAGLDQTFNLSNQLPVVTTLAADQLTTNSARLRGQVNPRGWPTTAWFEWGTATNYGNVIGTQDAGQGSSIS
ncbi:MAG TPA: C-type lectin domain-containing protein, partial [Candidatus Saccharimonadales bacterium]|nr:C-type lectin domain-containing protein [Candidatus Saccharimonadales bacterium]